MIGIMLPLNGMGLGNMKKIIIGLLSIVIIITIFSTTSMNGLARGKITNITTTSKGYSTSAKWTKVKGATGYEIYYSKSKNGKLKLLKKVKKSQFTHKELEMNKKYFYKIRSYSLGKKTTYGAYSTKIEIKTKLVDKPKVYLKTQLFYGYPLTKEVWISIANAGNKNVKILTKGKIVDSYDSGNNRTLTLVDKIKSEYYYSEPFIIKPTYYATLIRYIVDKKTTVYNYENAHIKIYYEYEGKTFTAKGGYYYNLPYKKYVEGYE